MEKTEPERISRVFTLTLLTVFASVLIDTMVESVGAVVGDITFEVGALDGDREGVAVLEADGE